MGDLAQALGDPEAMVRWDAAVALDRVIGEPAAAPLIDHVIHDPSVDVRTSCAKALRHYLRQDVTLALANALSDETFGVRHEAHASLVEMTGTDLGYDVANWRAVIQQGIPGIARGKTARPWWDWAGTTQKKQDEKRDTRPWWDWMGVARKAQTQPASAPVSQEGPP